MKICASCGRKIEPRKKWEKIWDQIKYCSDRCRKNKKPEDYRSQILELLKSRGNNKTICPSEILPEDQKSNKTTMEKVRISARHLVAEGKIQILQNGRAVDPSTAKGPIRLKLLKKLSQI